jgi:hypothetical protein
MSEIEKDKKTTGYSLRITTLLHDDIAKLTDSQKVKMREKMRETAARFCFSELHYDDTYYHLGEIDDE